MPSAQAWAPPLTWGPWVNLRGHSGMDRYTVSFDTDSQAPSSFDVEIEYATSTQMKRVNTLGPGSYQITDNDGAGIYPSYFKLLGRYLRQSWRIT
ncbi:colicin Z C-terminal domain-related protein [uncultured Cedecea sp.]|uniref:colicin Z C-terminal domain-related protein n=1 Tax=uncultured Cedecea sp. TaxID=988762 RepID=UPI0026389E30|nr:colicin Z C-terminal domain-related protein [uncultured Cedecea sp.]